jgi:hypothetical protein
MVEKIEFRKVPIISPETKQKTGDAIAVVRGGRQVALLPEADRLRRALTLTLSEIEDTLNNFTSIMGREPTKDEMEFWKAVLDYKRSQSLE